MKVAICSSFVPFVRGGDRNIVNWLAAEIEKCGHQVERVFLPHADVPQILWQQMSSYRWVNLTESADRIICIRPPAHFIQHANKILWFIHHLRVFYDFWDSPYRFFPDDLKHQGMREALFSADTLALQEAKKIYTVSNIVSKRLKHYNNVSSEILYPPLYNTERFYNDSLNDEIVCVARVESAKRQHLLVEALIYTKTKVKIRLCGRSNDIDYIRKIETIINSNQLQDRAIFENQWISEERKAHVLARCLAAAYLPENEDSYGYSGLEASYSQKAILTTTDAGGVLELVQHGVNGLVVEPTPQALAEAMDELYLHRETAQQMGHSNQSRLSELNISWSHVMEKLLA